MTREALAAFGRWDRVGQDAMLPGVSRSGRRLILASLGLLAASCLAPTIPMPPPARPEIQGPNLAGEVTLLGHVDSHSEVYAQNMRTGDIRGQHTNDGAYRIVIRAQVDDWMQPSSQSDGGAEAQTQAAGAASE
jgi:hypothetical protein